jgi:hypothetical protein
VANLEVRAELAGGGRLSHSVRAALDSRESA